jgi:hypothetical protein
MTGNRRDDNGQGEQTDAEFGHPEHGSWSSEDKDSQMFMSHLREGETLLWIARPLQGIRFSRVDIALIPGSLIGLGIALLSLRANGFDDWIPLIGLTGSLIAGLFFLIGRFPLEARKRARTVYGLTNLRALVLQDSDDLVRSAQLQSLKAVSMEQAGSMSGSLALALENEKYSLISSVAMWSPSAGSLIELMSGNTLPNDFPVIFGATPQVAKVHDLVLKLRNLATAKEF